MAASEGFTKCSCQHCGGHIEFPSAGAGRSIPCPHCNKHTQLQAADPQAKAPNVYYYEGVSYRVILLLALCVVITGVALLFFFRGRRGPQTAANEAMTNSVPTNSMVVEAAPEPPPNLWKGLIAGRVKLEKSDVGSLVYAVGTISNSTDHERFGVKVELNILNSAKEKIGTATDYTPSIEPGKRWKYKALVTDRNAHSAQLSSVKEN